MSRFIVLYSFIVLSCKFNHFEHFRPLCPESGVVSSWSQTRRTQTRRRRTRTRRTRWTAPGAGSPGTRGSNCDENIALILACTPPLRWATIFTLLSFNQVSTIYYLLSIYIISEDKESGRQASCYSYLHRTAHQISTSAEALNIFFSECFFNIMNFCTL